MIESWQIPILKEAVDFLFDIGRFVLDEIKNQREQRKAKAVTPKPARANEQPTISTSDAQAAIVTNKDEALKSMIEESRLRQKEAEIQHLLKLAEIYNTNYRIAKEKYARWGDALVPPVVVHELEDAEEHLLETVNKLRTMTEDILGKRIDYQV